MSKDENENEPTYDEEEEFEAGDELGTELDDAEQDANQIASAQAELEAMKARLAELQKESEKDKAADASGQAEDPNADSSEVDARSIYVGQVDYACTPEELQQHFQDCGTVNRVTILSDKFGQPKGFAYVEFLEPEAVTQALLLDGSQLHNRAIKVLPKRTNVPGMRGGRGRGRAPFRGGRGFRGRGYYGGYYGGYGPARGRGRRGGYAPY